MKELLRKGRDKWTSLLLSLLVPLTVLPFLWPTDSPLGKVFLLAKFSVIMMLWLLHIDLMSLVEYVGLGVVACSMVITVVTKGGIGIWLLFMILFLCMMTFPKISLLSKFRKRLFLAFEIGNSMLLIFWSIANVISTKGIFSFSGIINLNIFGMVFFSTYLFSQCILGLYVANNEHYYLINYGVSTAFFAILIILTHSRSVLLAFVVYNFLFVILYFAPNCIRLYRFFHVFIFFCTIVLCIVIVCINNMDTVFTKSLTEKSLLGKAFFSGRESIWGDAISYIVKNPLWGNGNQYILNKYYTFEDEIYRYSLTYTSTHNVPLGIMLCMGILPTLFYFFLQLRPGHLYALNTESPICLRIPAICFMSAIVVTAFECSLTDAQLNFLFLPLLLGCAAERDEDLEVLTHE